MKIDFGITTQYLNQTLPCKNITLHKITVSYFLNYTDNHVKFCWYSESRPEGMQGFIDNTAKN